MKMNKKDKEKIKEIESDIDKFYENLSPKNFDKEDLSDKVSLIYSKIAYFETLEFNKKIKEFMGKVSLSGIFNNAFKSMKILPFIITVVRK